MTPETTTIIVSILAVIIAAIAIWRSGKAITVEGVTSTLEASIPLAQELAQVAQTAVQASEQLYKTGRITRDQRLDHAFAYARKWFPDLDQDQILTALESAVLVVNAVVDALPDKKSTLPPTPGRMPIPGAGAHWAP